MDKYGSHVLPRLVEITDWVREGVSPKEIAERLGVHYSTFHAWVKKGRDGEERYAPLAVVLTQAKKEPDRQVEAALLKRAIGYQYEEVTQDEKLDRDGNVQVLKKTVTRDVPPHLTSIIFFLANRQPERWRKDPIGTPNGKEAMTGVVELAARETLTPPDQREKRPPTKRADGAKETEKN